MKKGALIGIFLLIMLFPMTASAQGDQPEIPDPPPAGTYVLDTLDWLSPAQESEIDTMVARLDSEELAEMAVVTLDDCGDDKQKFRNDLFREWGIGHADDNDGLLIIVCWYGGDKDRRSLEQEVGYGMEATIPDLLTSKVAKQYFVPAFSTGAPDSEVISSGKAGEALVFMVKAYDGVIRGSVPAELQEQEEGGISDGWVTAILIVLLFALLLILVVGLWVGGGSSGGGGGGSSGSWSSGSSGSSSSSSSSGSSFGGGSSGGGGSTTGF